MTHDHHTRLYIISLCIFIFTIMPCLLHAAKPSDLSSKPAIEATNKIEPADMFDMPEVPTLPFIYRQISPFITEILCILACVQFSNPENKELSIAIRKFFYWVLAACGNTLIEHGIEKKYGYKTTFSSKFPYKFIKRTIKKYVTKTPKEHKNRRAYKMNTSY